MYNEWWVFFGTSFLFIHNFFNANRILIPFSQKNQDDGMICEAAEKYYKMCHLKNGDTSILDYNPIDS